MSEPLRDRNGRPIDGECDVSGLDLSDANLAGVSLKWATAEETDFSSARFFEMPTASSGDDERGATRLVTSSFYRVKASRAVFDGAEMFRFKMSSCDFTSASFRGARLVSASIDGTFEGADFRGADLSKCRGTRVNFVDAVLEDAVLSNAQLRSCRFDGANLRGATLNAADLWNCSFVGADLTRANLTGANLTGCDLEDATLTGCWLPDGKRHD